MVRRVVIATALVIASMQPAHAWWESGHHLITLLAYDQLSSTEQKELYRILKAHPRWEQDFKAPRKSQNVIRWQVGHSGYWPDVARKQEKYNRPTWHYELGSTLKIGKTNAPNDPGPLLRNATLGTHQLYVSQAIELCRNVLADRNRSDADRALAICWLAHCIGDIHQPCHGGSLYVEKVFPDGDRGANRIPTVQKRNLHALWDSLLGDRFDEGDIDRRMREIKSNREIWNAAKTAATNLEPTKWVTETREIALRATYTSEVLNLVEAVRRGGRTEIETVNLSELYLKNAGRIAHQRAAFAALRLAAVWRECLRR
jgi:hypothetical protein